MKILKLAELSAQKAKEIYEKNKHDYIVWKTGEEWSEAVDATGTPNAHLYKKRYFGYLDKPGMPTNTKPTYMMDVFLELNQNEHPVNLKVYISHISVGGSVVPFLHDEFNNPNKEPLDPIYVKAFMGEDGYGIDKFLLPVESKEIAETKIQHEGVDTETIEHMRFTRMRTQTSPAKEIQVTLEKRPKQKTKYNVYYFVKDLESGSLVSEKKLYETNDLPQAQAYLNAFIKQKVTPNGFVPEGDVYYIPEHANSENWDFLSNIPKKKAMDDQEAEEIIEDSEMGKQFSELEDLFSSSRQWYKKAQMSDYQGYFTGQVPEYLGGMVGSSAVEASEIRSTFGKTDDAINLVNRFDSSLLSNVAMIFNFARSGAYGVYLPALDRDIKQKALKKRLESQGYQVEIDQNGLLTAYHNEKDQEQIKQDVDRGYEELERSGGSVFGINMNSILNSSRQDAMESGSEDPDIWQWITVLHLGATLVHEAVHSKGNHDEGPSEAAEAKFIQWALPIVNEEYKNYLISQGKEDLYAPLMIGSTKRYASRVVTAQGYVPRQFLNSPQGSDLSGRFPSDINMWQGQGGIGPWSMVFENKPNVLIEKMLGRQFMSPLPPDLSQENDILEEQLRKYTRGDDKIDPRYITEEWLARDYDDPDNEYKLLEELLDENRPHPLMLPLEKEASLNKVATLFGWMNNLDITIQERVWPWAQDEQDFKEDEKWKRRQPRYNPSYDIKGFYYRWIEPRFAPERWDSMVRDNPGVHPARRFASAQESEYDDLPYVLSVIGNVKDKLRMGNIRATRLVCTEDILNSIIEAFSDFDCQLVVFEDLDYENEDKVCAIWVADNGVGVVDIEKAEQCFKDGNVDADDEEFLESLFMVRHNRAKAIKKIIGAAKEISKEYGIKDVYIVGGYVRDLIINFDPAKTEDIDFSSAWANQCLKVGGLVAERLGVADVDLSHRTMTLSFKYEGVKVDFKGKFFPTEIRKMLRERKLPTTPLNFDIYNRDFTINILIYNIHDGKIYDISGESITDINNKIIRTYFDPDDIVQENPLIILRAIKFKIRYDFEIDSNLERAMIANSHLLFEGDLTVDRLISEREKLYKEGIRKGMSDQDIRNIFLEYGLEELERL